MADPELSAPATDGDGQGAGGAAATASPVPFTREEWDSINATIWSDLEADPYRFSDLLTTALGTLAGMALDDEEAPWPSPQGRLATQALRDMEQRALWGPDHEQEDHR